MISSRNSLLLAGLLASATFASSAPSRRRPRSLHRRRRPRRHRPARTGPRKHRARATATKRFERMQAPSRRTPGRAEGEAAAHAGAGRRMEQLHRGAAAAGPRRRQARPDRAEFAKLTTPQRLDRMQTRQAERSAMFAKRIDATRSFYAALTPEQQKTFDAEVACASAIAGTAATTTAAASPPRADASPAQQKARTLAAGLFHCVGRAAYCGVPVLSSGWSALQAARPSRRSAA